MPRGERGGSEYWAEIRDFPGGRTPPVDLAAALPLGAVVDDLHDALVGRYVLAWAAEIDGKIGL